MRLQRCPCQLHQNTKKFITFLLHRDSSVFPLIQQGLKAIFIR